MATTAAQPIAAPQARSSAAAGDRRVTARAWFASGVRRPYDPLAKTMLEAGPAPLRRRPEPRAAD
jgi:hypothetical protein